MTFEVLEKLEAKVQSAVDTISLLQMELDEVKEKNARLEQENTNLKTQHEAWQDRVRALLGKIEQVEESA